MSSSAAIDFFVDFYFDNAEVASISSSAASIGPVVVGLISLAAELHNIKGIFFPADTLKGYCQTLSGHRFERDSDIAEVASSVALIDFLFVHGNPDGIARGAPSGELHDHFAHGGRFGKIVFDPSIGEISIVRPVSQLVIIVTSAGLVGICSC